LTSEGVKSEGRGEKTRCLRRFTEKGRGKKAVLLTASFKEEERVQKGQIAAESHLALTVFGMRSDKQGKVKTGPWRRKHVPSDRLRKGGKRGGGDGQR